jgi:hypothetical protein
MTKKKEKIEVDVTIGDVDKYLDKHSIQSIGWEEGTLMNWLDNPNFADFMLGVYALWRHKNELLDCKTIEILLPFLSRGVVYDYMNRMVKTGLAKEVLSAKGKLKAISPAYNLNNQLMMAKYVRKAFICARHKEFDTRKAISRQNNNSTTKQ